MISSSEEIAQVSTCCWKIANVTVHCMSRWIGAVCQPYFFNGKLKWLSIPPVYI
jgi:hypothetical protein